jgi:hypothetical protein
VLRSVLELPSPSGHIYRRPLTVVAIVTDRKNHPP